MRIPFMLLLLGLMVVAGCLDAGTGPQDATASTPAASRVVTLKCEDGCWEPTVALAPGGTVYVTSAEQSLWALSPDADTFELVPVPKSAPGAGRGDVSIHADGAGNLYYSALTMDEVAAGIRSRAIEVHVSHDGGATWTSRLLGPDDGAPDGASDHALAADRQWLFFDNRSAYMTFQRPLGTSAGVFTSEVVLAEAPLGTVEFGDWRMVTPLATRAQAKIHGQGLAIDDGVLVPVWMPGPQQQERWGYWMAHVTPDGITYHDVGQDTTGAWFPALTRLHDGSYAAAWWAGGDIMAAWSPNAHNWSEPVTVGGKGITSPWITAWQGGAALLWHEADGEGTRLLLATGTPNGWNDPVVVAENITGRFGRASNTDMAYLVADEDHLVAVWSSVATNHMGVARYLPGDL